MDIKPEEIKKDDIQYINEEYLSFADDIGLEKAIMISQKYGGAQLYIPKFETLSRAARDRRIQNDFKNGQSYRLLAQKYNLSKVYIRQIVGAKKYIQPALF